MGLWCGTLQSEALQHAVNIALMERRLPSNGGESLWEREGLCVRFLLEDGKLNLCLRLLSEFFESMRQQEAKAEMVKRVAVGANCSSGDAEQQLGRFEENLGSLVECMFEAVECWQTCDLPLFCEHVRHVLVYAATQLPLESWGQLPEAARAAAQECQVVGYLAQLGALMEQLGEDRVMALVEQHQLMQATLTWLCKVSALPHCWPLGHPSTILGLCSSMTGTACRARGCYLHASTTTRSRLCPPCATPRATIPNPSSSLAAWRRRTCWSVAYRCGGLSTSC